jgi:hypothetical protein
MNTETNNSEAACWVDVFEHPHFGGRVYRIFGPGEWRGNGSANRRARGSKNKPALRASRPRIGSLIVGPGAQVHCRSQSGDQEISLSPRRVVVDVSALASGGSVDVVRVVNPVPARRKPAMANAR